MTTTSGIRSIEDALTALGVQEHSLKAGERESLDTQGFVVLEGVLSKPEVNQCQQSFDREVARQLPTTPSQKETGTRHIKDLHLVESLWRVAVHPRVLAAAFHILNRRFVCAIPHGREPLPGFGQQGLHMDWSTGGHGNIYYVATGICLLDDFTNENGATRIVPGSHRNTERPNKKISDPGFVHPKQMSVTASAGSVLFFNGHLLHSGTRNRSSVRRRTLQFSFIAYDIRIPIAGNSNGPPVSDPAITYIFGGDEHEQENSNG